MVQNSDVYVVVSSDNCVYQCYNKKPCIRFARSYKRRFNSPVEVFYIHSNGSRVSVKY